MSKKEGKYKDEVKVKEKEDFFEEDELEDVYRSNNIDYEHKIWISEFFDDFDDLLNHYSKIDNRLRWLGISDILYSPRSSYLIKHDKFIIEFIDEFMIELDYLLNMIKRKKLSITEDDQTEFDRLFSLNKDKIYSRISFSLEKRFV